MDKQTQKNLLDLVKRNYDEIAADFDTTRKKYLWPELIKLTAPVKDGDRVLDVGCGNGRLVEAFKDKKISYVGVDNSERLIEAAKNNFQTVIADISKITSYLSSSGERQRDPGIQKGEAQINLDSPPAFASAEGRGNDKAEVIARNDNNNFKFQLGDILELDKLPEKDFDYVFCVAVLHHLPGYDLRIKVLEQMKNKLKPGGKIILLVWNLWRRPKFRNLIFKTFLEKILRNLGFMSRRYGRDPDFALRTSGDFGDILFDWKNNRGEKISQRYYHAFTKRQLKKIFKKVGLRIEKIYKDKYNYYLILAK